MSTRKVVLAALKVSAVAVSALLPTSLLFTPMSNAEPVNDFYDAIPGDVGDPGSVIRTEPLALAGAVGGVPGVGDPDPVFEYRHPRIQGCCVGLVPGADCPVVRSGPPPDGGDRSGYAGPR